MIFAVGFFCFVIGCVVGALIGAAITYDALLLVDRDPNEFRGKPL